MYHSKKVKSGNPAPQTHEHEAPSKNSPNAKRLPVVLPLESPSQGPPASEKNSAIRIFHPFAAPLSPCLTPSALIEEGSKALGLSRAIYEDIRNGRYECFICKKSIRPVSQIRSCQICLRVLHLSCVVESLHTTDYSHCPACSLYQLELPWNYTCWCGKKAEPHPLLVFPPPSCGQACSRVSVGLVSLGKSCCQQPCEFICHAGPCPPCGYEEPTSDQSSEDRSRHPTLKRAFEEIDGSITHDDDTSKTRISISYQLG